MAENGLIGPTKLPYFDEKEAENEYFLYLTSSNMVETSQQQAQIQHKLPNSSGCLKFWFDFNVSIFLTNNYFRHTTNSYYKS